MNFFSIQNIVNFKIIFSPIENFFTTGRTLKGFHFAMVKILIVGGVAGGATASARLRRLSEQDEIIVFERDEYVSFANCGLPYHLSGAIPQRKDLILQTPESLHSLYNTDIRIFSEVVSVDKVNKKVTVKEVKTGRTYEENYDKLILSPGAKPIKPPTAGSEQATNIFTLRTVPDTDLIKEHVANFSPKEVVVIGGGFIGVETAENLVELGLKVTMIELANQILAPLDWEMAKIAQNELVKHGVKIILEDVVQEFKDEGKTLILKSGKELHSDLTILAIGVTPDNKLAKEGGLKCGPRGHIVTSKTLQTYDAQTGELVPDIYAIGDAIEVFDLIDDSKTGIALAWPANRQGRLVADHINGLPVEYKGSLGTSVLKVFDLVVSATGNPAKLLNRKNVPNKSLTVIKPNHVTYYPGAQDIFLKLVFCPNTGRILGAQAVGGVGTEKRIDVIATAIKGGLTVRNLADLELAYAPPFGAAKDPVNIIGYAATNYLDGIFETVYYDQIDEIVKNGGFLLDSRPAVDYEAGHIPGAINIPACFIRTSIEKLPQNKDTPIYVNCRVGQTSYVTICILRQLGFTKLYNFVGGYKLYAEVKK